MRLNRGATLLIGIVIAAGSVISYCSSQQENPVTGEKQYIKMTPDQEIKLGLQGAPEMAAQFGGLYQDEQVQMGVKEIGQQVVRSSGAARSPYEFDFHVLADPNTVNAFALPGGQIFITYALLSKLETPGQLAGVLGHEIAHVVGRHSAEQISKQQLTQGLTGAAVVAAYDPENPNMYSAAMAQIIAQMITMKYGRDDELEADHLGVKYMSEANYNPESMVGVMKILASSGSPNRSPEFMSTHPDPGNRVERIKEAISVEYPGGVPDELVE